MTGKRPDFAIAMGLEVGVGEGEVFCEVSHAEVVRGVRIGVR